MVEYLGGALLFHMHPQPASPDQFDRFAFPVLLYLSQSFRLRYFVYMSFTELILVSTKRRPLSSAGSGAIRRIP